jgi:hypothetical protein
LRQKREGDGHRLIILRCNEHRDRLIILRGDIDDIAAGRDLGLAYGLDVRAVEGRNQPINLGTADWDQRVGA